MQDVFLVGDQPIPGYRLLENIGGSAFYRMWKVQTPEDGIRVWKEIDLVVGNAAVETRTLGLLVQLRHPHLCTLTNFWHLGNSGQTLVIESELPEMTLRQRLLECQKQGMPGIPGEEMVRYLADAADGLDFLNAPKHQFQGQQVAVYHRALRPDCLLIFQDGPKRVCKVSDFGLAKPVTDQVAQHSQGLMHYEYDPPEFFEGQTTGCSDQYSLAINYYELRTGSLPFKGTMLEQLQARLSDAPNLDQIGDAERTVIRRALSRDPQKRFENCSALAKAMKQAVTQGMPVIPGGQPAPSPGLSTAKPMSAGFQRPMSPPPPASPASARQPYSGPTPVVGTPAVTRPTERFQRPAPQQPPAEAPRPQNPPAPPPPMQPMGNIDSARRPTPDSVRAKQPPKANDVRAIRQQLSDVQGIPDGTTEGKIPVWVVVLVVAALGAVGYFFMNAI